MRTLKDAGMREVAGLLRRTRRQRALRRIGEQDAAYIEKRLTEVEARIVSMQEFNEHGEEE